MSTRVVDRVDEWDGRPFSDGYRELHALADQEFSGVVRAGAAELYMTKGVVVGTRQGSIEDFEEAEGTVYEAPSEALPLLAVMQEQNTDVRDQFYTEKTPISDVDKTLSDGGFTGFVELSENVLSGDYYLVYHGGRSMSVGFVGESARLIDGDEAFETADDEVGIYKVRPADVDRIEIPEVSEPASSGRDAGAVGGASETPDQSETDDIGVTSPDSVTDQPGGDQPSTPAQTQEESPAETEESSQQRGQREQQPDPGRTADAESAPRSDGPDETDEDAAGSGAVEHDAGASVDDDSQTPQAGASEQGAARTDPSQPAERASHTDEPERRPSDVEDRTTQQERSGQTQPSGASEQGSPTEQPPSRADPQPGRQEPTPEETEWEPEPDFDASGPVAGDAGGDLALEQRAIPSLDPSQTREPARGGRDGGQQTQPTQQPSTTQTEEPQRQEPRREQTQRQQTDATPQRQQTDTTPQRQQADTTPQRQQADTTPQRRQQAPGESVDPEQIERLEADIEEKEAEIQRLEDELRSANAESDRLREDLESVREERDALEAEVERLDGEARELEAEVERLESELGASTDAERRITEGEALAGTDIFIRYYSKGDATLEKAHGGAARKDEVHENLRLEKHTQFDADAVAVGGQSYDEYLEGTVEYQFVKWLVRQLLFEIRETGHEKKLKDLYDVLPAVDRAELSGVVEAVYTADGQETRREEAFDVILRNRMGTPLLVANLNDSREAATESMMEDLITAAERVGQSADEFAGAFLVTKSFFDPGALEIAEESTQGGLFSRDKRKSFVNLSRKQGYHLCLVEARNENFHLTVPEL
jgi:hypothetical protein